MATKKRRSRGVNHKNGVSVLPEGVEQREKHGGNEGFPSGGAPGGATWSEIRELIARCEELPASVRKAMIEDGDLAVGNLAERRLMQ